MINNNLTINGPGPSLLTIRAFDAGTALAMGRRILNVYDGNGTIGASTVAISGLTLTGGDVASTTAAGQFQCQKI